MLRNHSIQVKGVSANFFLCVSIVIFLLFIFCYTVPSKVRNLKVLNRTTHTIVVSWDVPQYERGQIRGYVLNVQVNK